MSRIAAFNSDAKACLNSDSWNSGDPCQATRGFFDLRTEDNTFMCKWFSCKTKRECQITYIASDDYPENCCVFLVRKGEASTEEKCESCSLPLVVEMMKLSSELQQEDEEAITVKPLTQSYSEDILNVMSHKTESTDEAGSDSSEEDCDYYYSSDRDNEDSADDIDAEHQRFNLSCPTFDYGPGMHKREELEMVHLLLHKDICTFQEFACTLNGSNSEKSKRRKTFSSLATRIFSELGEVDCQLKISLDDLNLSYQLCSAWKLKADEPLVVHLNFNNDFYLDCQYPPQVRIFQSTKYSKSVLPQIQNILKFFLQELWDKKLISNSILESATQHSDVPQKLHTQVKKTDSESMDMDSMIRLQGLLRLTEMGFDECSARHALECTNYDHFEACNLLSQQFEDLTPVNKYATKSLEIEKPNVYQSANPQAHCSCKQAVNSATADASLTISTLGSHSSGLGTSSYDVKQMPSLEDGFIVMIYKYVCQRLPSLNEFCIICDNPHSFADAAMLMPAVCTRELCIFGYRNLGVMGSTVADIATGAQVVDLLMTLVRAASFSPRCTQIFDPFPSIVDPSDNTIVVSDKKKHFGMVRKLLTKLPANSDILRCSPSEMHTRLEKSDKFLLPLLTWIIHSNRSHIVRLPKEKQFDFMNTPHQFLLLSSPPDQESQFRDLKKTHGSTFAFHGSPIENWHSIIRKGLMVASGTIYQLNGAAYGRGIYLSPNTQISVEYCKNKPSRIASAPGGMGSSRPALPPRKERSSQPKLPATKEKMPDKENFLNGENFTCMALCEVIKSEKLQHHNTSIWIVTDEKHVCTRFFFLWENNSQPKSVNITQSDLMKQVADSIAMTAGIYS